MNFTCETYRSIFDYACDAIFIYDIDTGAIIDANNKVNEMYGYTPEEARNADMGLLSAGLYPYDQEGALERIRQASATEQLFEWLAKDRSGRTFWVEINLKRVTIGGQDRVLAAVRDITKRKRTEQRLSLQYTVTRALTEAKLLKEATPALLQSICEHVGWDHGEVWFIDADSAALRLGGVWHSNSANFTEFRAASAPLTFSQGSGLPGRVWAEGRAAWIQDLANDPGFLRTNAAAAAGLRAAFAFPIKSAGVVVGAMAFFSRQVQKPDENLLEMFDALGSQIGDFIQRKKAEEELHGYAAALERSNSELTTFASVASHDLQEPLRVVAGFAQLIERRYKGKLDSKGDEFIQFIIDGTQRMQRLIRDLLDYSRLTTTEKKLTSVDCNRVLEAALENLKTAIDKSKAVVTIDSLPTVVADQSQLVRLFQNLIGNAVKYQRDKTPAVHVSARWVQHISKQETEADIPGWVFSVEDNGIGIEQEHFERIFQPFERLHTREKYTGTGIGLAICKKIVEHHGGNIRVSSKPGIGSTFSFTLPDPDGETKTIALDPTVQKM